ncbi:unnamed protein product [Amaranthus hypochondriacus]
MNEPRPGPIRAPTPPPEWPHPLPPIRAYPPAPRIMNRGMGSMDPKLKEAACSGDIEFLKTTSTSGSPNQPNYFFLHFIPSNSSEDQNLSGNVLHLSAANGKVDFFKEVLNLLPKSQSQMLLSQINKNNLNPLQIAAQLESHKESLEIVKLILEFYKGQHSPMMMKPWLLITNSFETPLHLAIKSLNEESALEIMAMDMEYFCNKLDRDKNSVLFLAVKNGLNSVAEKILESSFSYSLGGQDNSTALHYAPFSSENILKLLLHKHSELIDTVEINDTNVLHQWAQIGKAWPLKWLLEEAYKNDLSAAKTKVFSELISMSDSDGENPLHIAMSTGDNNIEFLEYLLSGYTKEKPSIDCPILRAKNDWGDTPFHVALSSKQGKAVLHILSLDPAFSEIDNDDNESPLFLAIKHELPQVAETLLKYKSCSVSGPNGYTPLHYAPYSSENVLKLVFEKYPEFIDAVSEGDEYTILHQWAKIGKAWPLIWLLDEDQKKDLPAVKAKIFGELIMMSNCVGNNPLHIAASTKEDDTTFVEKLIHGYKEEKLCFGEMFESLDCTPWKAKNNDGNTPLHVALSSKQENIALYLLSIDPTVCEIDNEMKESPLFLAVKNGMNKVALEILESNFSYSVSGPGCSTPLHYAPYSSECILRLLLKKKSYLLDEIDQLNGFNVLHQWARIGKYEPLMWLSKDDFPEEVRTKVFKDLIMIPDKFYGDNPIHCVVKSNPTTPFKMAATIVPPFDSVPMGVSTVDDTKLFLEVLVTSYLEEQQKAGESSSVDYCPPLRAANINGNTPLHLALSSGKQDAALYMLSIDPTISQIDNYNKESPLFLAVKHGLNIVAEEIGKLETFSVNGPKGYTPLHYAPYCSENIFKTLLMKHPELIDAVDEIDGYNALHKWAFIGKVWPLKLLLETGMLDVRTAVFKKSILKHTLNNENPIHIAVKGIHEFEATTVTRSVLPFGIAKKGVPPPIPPFHIAKNSVKASAAPPFNNINFFPPAKSNRDSIDFVKVLIEGYQKERTEEGSKSTELLDCPPLKAKDDEGNTPLHTVLSLKCEELALYFLSLDSTICMIKNKKQESPLFLAVKNGMSTVAEKILVLCDDCVGGPHGCTPLHYAPLCPENFVRMLLKKHPELLDAVDQEGSNVLHQWVQIGRVWPFKLLKKEFPEAMNKVYGDLIEKINKEGDTPLHIAARAETYNRILPTKEVTTALFPAKEGAVVNPIPFPANEGIVANPAPFPTKGTTTHPNLFPTRVAISNPAIVPPWNKQKYELMQNLVDHYMTSTSYSVWQVRNNYGNTPLHEAVSSKNEEVALLILKVDSSSCQLLNDEGESPLFLAVKNGCPKVIDKILSTKVPRFRTLRRKDGQTVLHNLRFCPEKTCRQLLEKFWWIINLRDDKGRTAFDEANANKVGWLANLLKEISSIEKEPFDFITACDKDDLTTVIAFIDNDVLHHIKLQTYQDYLNFLKNPTISELKNYITESDGATPLHRALARKEMHLAKVLLKDNEVERNIKNKSGKTAMDLLLELCENDKNWENLCLQIKVNPRLKTNYIQPGTNLDQMRNTLSVVAALLATITFAAGFTLPGGLKSDTGEAMLAKKASFLVFLLADAFAMSTSMLVLCCLLWSMVCHRDMSYLLVDRSVMILLQSLYATMVAFMTGVYAVIEHSSLWAAIIIIIMCSFIGISANRTVLHNIAKLIPSAKKDRKSEEKASTSANNESPNAKGRIGNLLKNFASFLRVKFISKHNEDKNSQHHSVDQEGGAPQKAEGISGILSMRLRKSKPVNDHVQKHQNNQVDQGQASTSRNDDLTKAVGHSAIDIS